MGTEVLDQLDEGIDALAGLDVDSLTDAELDALVIGLRGCGTVSPALTASALARWDGRGVWLVGRVAFGRHPLGS